MGEVVRDAEEFEKFIATFEKERGVKFDAWQKEVLKTSILTDKKLYINVPCRMSQKTLLTAAWRNCIVDD